MFTKSIINRNENLEYIRFSEGLVKELSQIIDKIKLEASSLESKKVKESNLSFSSAILIGKILGYSIEYWLPPAIRQAGTFIETISLASQRESGLIRSSTGDIENDILSITSAHSMREEAMEKFLKKADANWSIVKDLISQSKIIEFKYEGNVFYMGNLRR